MRQPIEDEGVIAVSPVDRPDEGERVLWEKNEAEEHGLRGSAVRREQRNHPCGIDDIAGGRQVPGILRLPAILAALTVKRRRSHHCCDERDRDGERAHGTSPKGAGLPKSYTQFGD